MAADIAELSWVDAPSIPRQLHRAKERCCRNSEPPSAAALAKNGAVESGAVSNQEVGTLQKRTDLGPDL
jgi:hypothetical protein